MGMFSVTGDPSLYWLCGEAALVVGLVSSGLLNEERSRGVLTVALLCILVAQLALFVRFRNDLPAVAFTRADGVLRGTLATDAAGETPLCMVVDNSGTQHVLANGAFFTLNPATTPFRVVSNASDCLDAARGTDLVIIENMMATDWGPGGIELARSAQIASEAPYVLPVESGIVTPHTHAGTPTGFGAFGNMTDTPVGAVGDFTVLSGFSYRFNCVPRGNWLAFAIAAIPHAAFTYEVLVDSGGGPRPINTQSLPSSPGSESPPAGTPYEATQAWQLHIVALPSTPACRSIIFSVPARSGVPGTWVTVVGASLLDNVNPDVRKRGTE